MELLGGPARLTRQGRHGSRFCRGPAVRAVPLPLAPGRLLTSCTLTAFKYIYSFS